jgi:hypothetical protein
LLEFFETAIAVLLTCLSLSNMESSLQP